MLCNPSGLIRCGSINAMNSRAAEQLMFIKSPAVL
jgi:hypothetical protein